MTAIKLKNKVWQDPRYFIAFGFGLGLSPIAPGTFGTLAAIPLYLLIAGLPLGWYLSICALAFLLGIWLCHTVSCELQVDDYSGIVWDEIVGFLLTMTMAPPNLIWIGLGFILFRFFDILKPEPIAFLEKKIKGGIGVMLDDLLAAAMAFAVLQLLVWGFGR